jgi:hypothetical protein
MASEVSIHVGSLVALGPVARQNIMAHGGAKTAHLIAAGKCKKRGQEEIQYLLQRHAPTT